MRQLLTTHSFDDSANLYFAALVYQALVQTLGDSNEQNKVPLHIRRQTINNKEYNKTLYRVKIKMRDQKKCRKIHQNTTLLKGWEEGRNKCVLCGRNVQCR